MDKRGGWRHELKFVCTLPQLIIIENRIRPLLRPDPHAGRAGMYSVRSVYFDDRWDSGYYENEDGTDPREKFRIRIYNGNGTRIALECKQKRQGLTRKQSCVLTQGQCVALLQDKKPQGELSPLLRKFVVQRQLRGLTAKVIVEYDRRPYIYGPGNVRITLDQGIRASGQTQRFLEGDFLRRPVQAAGEHVLEVKYDDFLPDAVAQMLRVDTLHRTSFSKYYLCRRYGCGQGMNTAGLSPVWTEGEHGNGISGYF